jgi:ADP-ribose pyrophosphatase
MEKWQILKSQMIIDHQWCQVRQDQVKLPHGQIIDDFFVNVRPDIALILPLTCQNEIVFVKQYRHGVGEILLELPAGAFLPEEENPILAAKRELVEETGYIADDLIPLGILYDNPVKDTNKIHLFLAKNVHKSGEQTLDITEDIEVILIPINQVMTMINQGKITVSGTITAIFLGLNKLDLGNNKSNDIISDKL